MIDTKVALATASRLAKPGPDLNSGEVADVVAELRVAAHASRGPVAEYTGLTPTGVLGGESPVFVVDRARWVEANLGTFSVLTDSLERKLAANGKAPRGAAKAVSEKVAGVQIGAVMSFVATKVLGQFDPFWTGQGGEGGRLLLVAPNLVSVERELNVKPRDFRLWVCLHEETHRVQFTAVPWMREHMRSLIDQFVDVTPLDEDAIGDAAQRALSQVSKAIRGKGDASLTSLFQNDQQRAVVERITGMMSLLEGHADVVMDGVGPDIVPTVAQIRRKFDKRRHRSGGLDRIIRRLLGLDQKAAQYRDGAKFVRHVVDRTALTGFNAVWESPINLPSRAEILDPDAWLKRVHGA